MTVVGPHNDIVLVGSAFNGAATIRTPVLRAHRMRRRLRGIDRIGASVFPKAGPPTRSRVATDAEQAR